MSGGSYDYIYSRIEQFAGELRVDTLERRLFRDLLYRVAKAAHDIEWVDSGDCSPGDEDKAIIACLADNRDSVISEYLEELYNTIGNYINRDR